GDRVGSRTGSSTYSATVWPASRSSAGPSPISGTSSVGPPGLAPARWSPGVETRLQVKTRRGVAEVVRHAPAVAVVDNRGGQTGSFPAPASRWTITGTATAGSTGPRRSSGVQPASSPNCGELTALYAASRLVGLPIPGPVRTQVPRSVITVPPQSWMISAGSTPEPRRSK